MKILSIETSCDETAVSIIEASGGVNDPSFRVLSNLVLSQVKLHEKYGGVFPSLAKREHSKNLIPLIQKALEEAGLLECTSAATSAGASPERRFYLTPEFLEKIKENLSHEPALFEALRDFLPVFAPPKIDLIAVTFGPGLEPALWVGINAAKILGEFWGLAVMPINHMEGHISSVFLEQKAPVEFPALALLISGGHTELVLVPDRLEYKIIGQTRDDAVGEAYDKVARMLGLPYPGGPQIARLATEAREGEAIAVDSGHFVFPRPMIKSDDFDFSFSGLKTSVLYAINKIPEADFNNQTKKAIALAFEDAVVETLVSKTAKAIHEFAPRTLIIAGGVIANKTIRQAFEKLVADLPDIKLLVPTHELSTDNALMIGLAAYIRHLKNPVALEAAASTEIKAEGNATF